MYSAAIIKNQPSHHARFAPDIIAGVIAGKITCLIYRHPVKPKLLADSTILVGIPLMAPRTPKNTAQAIDVKSKTITESSMPIGPNTNRKPMTIGKYPSIGMDCRRSMKGVRMKDATLFVAASMPKETPQRTEMKRVITIREMVLKVYNGRLWTSGYLEEAMINQAIMLKPTSPVTKLAKYLRKHHASVSHNCDIDGYLQEFKDFHGLSG